jgi:hypothetical protein
MRNSTLPAASSMDIRGLRHLIRSQVDDFSIISAVPAPKSGGIRALKVRIGALGLIAQTATRVASYDHEDEGI